MAGMGDMMGMMKKAKEMQKNLERMQKELEKVEMSATVADLVTISVSGKGEMTKIELSDDVMSQDKATLEDMILAAFNEAKEKVNVHTKTEMDKITGGIKLPF